MCLRGACNSFEMARSDETRSGRFIDAMQTPDVQPSVKLETVDLSSEDGKVEGSSKTFQE